MLLRTSSLQAVRKYLSFLIISPLNSAKLLIVCLMAFGAIQAHAATCTYTNFSIGLEISADAGPNAAGEFHYIGSSLRCSAGGTVIYDSGTGFPDPYDFGWFLPTNIVPYLRSTFGPAYAAGRYFVAPSTICAGGTTHVIIVSQYYPAAQDQNIDGVSMALYPPSNTATYLDTVFPAQYLYYPFIKPPGPQWDYIAQKEICESPPNYLQGPNCLVCGGDNGTNPVNTGWAGTKHQAERDFVAEGAFPLEFNRYYNSRTQVVPGRADANAQWSHSYNKGIVYKLVKSSTSDQGGVPHAFAYRSDGRILTFIKSSLSGWDPLIPDITERLVQLADGSYRLYTSDDQTEAYDSAGKLLSINNRAGLTHTLTYAATGISVADSFGHTLQIALASGGEVTSITTPKGEVYSYASTNGMYSSVTYPDNKTRSYEYQGNLLTGIINENGVRIAKWTYDSDSRAISSEHGGATDKYVITYPADLRTMLAAATPMPVTITDPRGTARSYSYSSNGTTPDVVKQLSSSLPCNTCGKGNIASSTYDTNGFVASETNFNGNITTYSHNVRGLETSRTEASGTPQARAITTAWHPAFRLPAQISEPGRTTDFVYDASKGTLLSKTITDTATNKKRIWTYTYNNFGQVLAIDAPRTDVTDTMTYTYDALGNLASKANALGHVTQYTAYDANGRLLSTTDPNGLTTAMTYDSRGRMLTRQVGVELTQFVYDAAGKLTKVISPDGTETKYSYD